MFRQQLNILDLKVSPTFRRQQQISFLYFTIRRQKTDKKRLLRLDTCLKAHRGGAFAKERSRNAVVEGGDLCENHCKGVQKNLWGLYV